MSLHRTSDVSIASSSQPSLSTIYIDDNSCLLISKLTDYREIHFNVLFGDLKVKLLFGNLSINEYELEANKEIDLYADKDNILSCKIEFDSKCNLMNLKNFLVKQQFTKHVRQEISRLNFTSINASYMILHAERNQDPLHLKYSYLIGRNVESNLIKLDQRERIAMKDDWGDYLINNLENRLSSTDNSSNKYQIIMVCGGKNSGKSTLIRHLINRQLSKVSKASKIFYLDLDPGQSEFTNSGQISLIEINKPILFPTHFNVAKFKDQVVFSCSVCSTNVEDLGSLYSENLVYLWTQAQRFIKPNDIIFVNTMGFVRIIGFMMLVDAIKLIRPNYLIEIKFELPEKSKKLYDINYSIDLTAKNVLTTKGWLEFDPDRLRLRYTYLQLTNEYDLFSSKNSKLKRINAQLVYLSLFDSLLERPINHLQPYMIKFSDVRIHLAIENQPEERLVLDILNCSWIQLCRVEEDHSGSGDLKVMKIFGSNQCLGNAFIRNIDCKNKLFYILTPENQDTISEVNCFVKPNSINSPKEVFIPQLVYPNCEPVYIDVNF